MSLGLPSRADPAAITPLRLQLFAARCDYTSLAPKLDLAARAHGITTPRRVRHWLAQLHHESAGLTILEENLSYSAERLTQVWPKRFPSLAAAAPFARNPRKLANKTYGGRLGNHLPDDGWTYRGRGLIQLTGRANYAAASGWSGLNLVDAPDLAMTAAPNIAAAFWAHHGLNEIVDADDGEAAIVELHARIEANEADDVREARGVINGASFGLDDVRAQLQRAATIWRD